MQLHRPSARACFVLLIGSLLGGPACAAAPYRLRVLTYNIHHGEGVDGALDLARIAQVIRSAEPDLVALQEVDRKTARTGRVAQDAELSRLSGMTVAFGKNIDFEGGGYGNAILSRLPMTVRENIVLPCLRHEDDDKQLERHGALREQRGVLVVEVQIPGGPAVALAATHLDARPWQDERLASAKMINARFAERDAGQPALLLGDLNATTDSRVLDEFRRAWQQAGDASREEAPTVPAAKPVRQIDFILYRPADRWRVIEYRVLPAPVASDHRPVLAVLELADAAP